MEKIAPNGDVNICFATDDNYVPHLNVTIKSLLCNRNRKFSYDIIVLCTDITDENRNVLEKHNDVDGKVSIRMVDVSAYIAEFKNLASGYLSDATYFRLLILSDLFEEYEKVLYLDSDVIVEGDISELFFANMNAKPIAAVEEVGMRQLSFSKKAVFLNGSEPFNADNYRTDALCMTHPEGYFNAGVLLFDLQGSRKLFPFSKVQDTLNRAVFFYNDQDVLNILYDGNVCLLDPEWNYQNCIESFVTKRPEIYGPMYAGIVRKSPRIIHFVSSFKPWKCEVALDSYYHKYET